MPGPVTPATPDAPATPIVAPAPPDGAVNLPLVSPAPVVPTPATPEPAVLVSENTAGSIVMPHVRATRPRIAGEDPVDRGDDAEFIVLGGRVGDFIRGSRLSVDDLGKDAAYERMIEMGVLAPIGPDGQPISPEKLKAMKAEFDASKKAAKPDSKPAK